LKAFFIFSGLADRIADRARGLQSPMSIPITFPLKASKPADLGGALLAHYATLLAPSPVPDDARAAARTLQARRERLAVIVKVSETTSEALATELLAYEWQLEQLQLRLDFAGTELGCRFVWRDAWKPKNKAEKTDLEWERVCVLFNAAAALSFSAGHAMARGPEQGGLREAVGLYQRAAGCHERIHAIVRAAIWGLSPRWDPDSLPTELTLDFVSALRDLALAQAQEAFYCKAVAERLSPSVCAKLAAASAELFSSSKVFFDRPAVVSYICGEAGLFSGQDRSWVTRVAAGELRARAVAEEAAAAEAAAEAAGGASAKYGAQVARLGLAASAAKRAAAAGSDLAERRFLEAEAGRVGAAAAAAAAENHSVYMEPVPPPAALPRIEPRRMVKSTPSVDGGAVSSLAEAFPLLLPIDVAAKKTALRGEVRPTTTWPYSFTSKLSCTNQSSCYCPPSICIAHTIAILLHGQCAIYDPPPNPPLCMPYTIQYWQ